MNKVMLMGRLTRDPEVKYSQGENPTAIARYTLAVDRRFKRDGEPTADFISCIAFGRPAEFTAKYFHQGLRVVIVGRIQTGSYTNRDGQKVYTTDVVVEEQEFADSKNSSGQQGGQFQGNGNGQQGGGQPSYGNGQQNGGQPSYGNGQQNGGQPNYGNGQQNGGQPSYGNGQQNGGQPSYGNGQQNGGQPSYGNGQQNGGQPSYGNGQQNGGQPSYGNGQQGGGQSSYGGGSFGMGDDGFMNIPEGLDEELPFN